MADEVKNPQEEPSFEKSLAELEQLVSRMEHETLPLETLLQLFEKGRKLADSCRGKLDELEQRIEILTKKEDGSGEWNSFQ